MPAYVWTVTALHPSVAPNWLPLRVVYVYL